MDSTFWSLSSTWNRRPFLWKIQLERTSLPTDTQLLGIFSTPFFCWQFDEFPGLVKLLGIFFDSFWTTKVRDAIWIDDTQPDLCRRKKPSRDM